MFRIQDKYQVNFTSSQGAWHELLSPNDHQVLTQIQYATMSDIEFLLSKLKNAQKVMGKLKAHERASILKKVAEKIKKESDLLSWLISAEGGKPLKDARVEVARAIVSFELCAEETLRLGGETIPMERTAAGENHLSFTNREPIGPVLAISAFNHPLNLLAHQVGPAIASGCAVVIKPAPATPVSAYYLEKFLIEAGLPHEGVAVVNADVPEIEKLVSSSEFSFISFIGSARVGWNIKKVMAPGTRLSLEHGGQAPAIVRKDANLDEAIPLLIKGSYYHAGQVCISTQRIFVHESIFQTFVDRFKDAAKKLKVGAATEDDTDVGPLIRPQEVVRITSWIDEAIKAGAKLEMGNHISGESKQYLHPTILTQVPEEAKVMKEEVFGPLVCINSYSDEDALVNKLNDNPYVFESCVFTQDINRALALAKNISTMTMVINNHSAYRVDWMPFGGHKLSGLGMGGIRYAIEDMTRLKQVIIRYH